jgi:hypothetical protein
MLQLRELLVSQRTFYRALIWPDEHYYLVTTYIYEHEYIYVHIYRLNLLMSIHGYIMFLSLKTFYRARIWPTKEHSIDLGSGRAYTITWYSPNHFDDDHYIYVGVYCSASGALTISASTVTLDGAGNSSSQWIFQTGIF